MFYSIRYQDITTIPLIKEGLTTIQQHEGHIQQHEGHIKEHNVN